MIILVWILARLSGARLIHHGTVWCVMRGHDITDCTAGFGPTPWDAWIDYRHEVESETEDCC